MSSTLQKINGMNSATRLPGIDLMRGVAVFAVTILHAGGSSPSTGFASYLEHISGFAVPFFLATAFYLAASKLYLGKISYSLMSRLSRLLIPYLAWVVIYIGFAALKWTIANRITELQELLNDPISILFVGLPAYHLYFIPLLLVGTILIKGAELFIRWQAQVPILLLLFLVSLGIYEVTLLTNNGFELSSASAFQSFFTSIGINLQQFPLLRISAILIAWLLRCSSYITVALILQHSYFKNYLKPRGFRSIITNFLIFLLINSFGQLFLSSSLYEVMRGYTALIFAISLSPLVRDNALVKHLGLCSFGIYLMHLIWVETFKTALGGVYPALLSEVTILSLFIFSVLAWVISWIMTAFILRLKGPLPKLLFGM